MSVEEFFELVKCTINPIVEALEKKQQDEAFRLYRESVHIMESYLTFLQENQILKGEEIAKLADMQVQAVENGDAFLLEDIVKYGIMDVIEQLEGEHE